MSFWVIATTIMELLITKQSFNEIEFTITNNGKTISGNCNGTYFNLVRGNSLQICKNNKEAALLGILIRRIFKLANEEI